MDICDFHSHILPKCDHGSNSVEVSLGQLELAKKYGVSRIVSTSHFYPHKDSAESFDERRHRCSQDLLSHLDKNSPKIALGAEILICDNIEELPGFDKLCIGGTKTCLIELPFNGFENRYVESVYNLISDGYKVVLAHCDRYPKENIEKMLDVGALIQLNADSLAKLFKTRHLYDWMERDKVVAIGSDIHKVNEKAYHDFSVARKKISKYLDYVKEKSDEMWQTFNLLNP